MAKRLSRKAAIRMAEDLVEDPGETLGKAVAVCANLGVLASRVGCNRTAAEWFRRCTELCEALTDLGADMKDKEDDLA
jgi:hypothetical protein